MHNPEYPHPAEEADREKKSKEAYERVKPELDRIKKELSDEGGTGKTEKNKGTFPPETIEDARRQANRLHPEE